MKRLSLFFIFHFLFLISHSQNVGIGTTSPLAKLDINGDIILRNAAVTLVNGDNNDINTTTSRFSFYTIAGPAAAFSISGLNGGVDGRTITLYNNTASQMTIKHLQLSAAANQVHTGTGTDLVLNGNSSVTLRYMSADSKWHVQGSFNNVTASAGTGWAANGNDLKNTNSGNVVIGSSNQSVYKLNVTGTDLGQTFYGADNSLYGSFSNSNGHFDIASNYGNTLAARPAKHILLNPPGTGVFFPGNVGINTDDPSHARLEINGRIGATVAMFGADRYGVAIAADNPEIGFNYYYNNATKTIKAGYAANFGMSPGNGDLYIGNFSGNQSASNFGDISGYQYCIIVKQNGNVGIGTTDPTYKLSVNGNIRSKEVVVESGWADFVFDEGYPLLPLAATEKFIEQNKHLPGIPSAIEIQTNGLSLGEVQKKMMQKIEELTLYIIELDKQVKTLKEQLAAAANNAISQ